MRAKLMGGLLPLLAAMLMAGCMPRLAVYEETERPAPRPAGEASSGSPTFASLDRPRLLAYIKARNPWIKPAAADRIADGILRWSAQLEVDPRLMTALIATESSFNPQARSKVGAMGLGQLMPATAKDLGVSDAYDIDQNLKGTASYLAWLLRNWQAHPQGRDYALASYNWGIGTMKRQVAAGNALTSAQTGYVQRILTHYQQL